jgi:hypothetical protein
MSNLKDVYVTSTWYPRSYRGKSQWWQVPKSVKVTKPQTQKDREIELAYRLAKGGG